MHYTLYPYLEAKYERILRKDRQYARMPEADIRREIGSTVAGRCWGVDQVLCDVLYAEWLHRRCGGRVLFVESMELLDFLLRARFQIEARHLTLPARLISVAVPSKAHGYLGFLIGRLDTERHLRDMASWLDWCGISCHVGPDAYKYPEYFLTVVNCGRDTLLRSWVPVSEVDNALDSQWYEDHVSNGSLWSPDANDRQLQAKSLMLGLRLAAYVSAFPQYVRDGLPEDTKRRNVEPAMAGRSRTVVMHERLRASPESHLRNCHFRTLGHERFKRDAQGNVRVIFVRPTIVGGRHLDPQTAEDMEGEGP